MKKFILTSVAVVFIVIQSSLPARAIENGESAVGSSRIISDNIFSGSAFLYDDRIIFTQGHAIMHEGKEQDLSFWRVTKPGTIINMRSKTFNVVKTFIAEGYKEWDNRTDWARTNDFGILITDKPVKAVTKAKLASKKQIDALKAAGAYATTGGYGFQSLEDRQNRKNIFGIVPTKMTLKFATGDYLPGAVAAVLASPNFPPNKGEYPEYLKYHLESTYDGPQTCDGDSGSGVFIESKKSTLYLGTMGVHLGIKNCGISQPIAGMKPLMGINPVYPYLDLIKEAEAWVKAHPVKK